MIDALNSVLVRRLGKVALPNKDERSSELPVGFIQELTRLGFAPSVELFEAVLENEKSQDSILDTIREYRKDTEYKPLHENFVEFMANASDFEIYFYQIAHYVSAYYDLDIDVVTASSELPKIRTALEKKNLLELGAADENEVQELAKLVLTQGQPYSDQDKVDVETLHSFVNPHDVQITIRENLATLAKFDEAWDEQFTTLTDVLRLATVLSGGDSSLSENVKFTLTRAQRRRVAFVMNRVLIQNNGNLEDISRYSEQWKRLLKSAHFGDFKYTAVSESIPHIYHETAHSFASRLETAKKNDVDEYLNLLESRPGVFAREVTEAIRKFPLMESQIISKFRKISQDVSLRVLIQLRDYLRGPLVDELPEQPLFAKSRSASKGVIPNKRVSPNLRLLEAVEYGFSSRLADRVFSIDADEAEQYAIPMGVRSASSAMRAIGRGSRVRLSEDTNVVRLFMHWKNQPISRVDLDLSAGLFNEDFSKYQPISYYNQRGQGVKAYHSGDIVDAPEGAAEFIDVDLESAFYAGYRYVVMTVNSYTGHLLSTVPEAWAGVMERTDVNSGENFEPSTVTQHYDLVTENRMSCPLIFDLKTREIIWVDRPVRVDGFYGNFSNTLPQSYATLREAVLQPRTSVAELLDLTGARIDLEKGDELNPVRTEQVLNLII